MNRTLSVAAAGMATQQTVLDVISANLANVDVPGFRASRADFAPFIGADGRLLAPRAASERTFAQGRLDFTDNPNDFAIEGAGFFAVRTTRGDVAFTRAGDFTPVANGRLRLRNAAAHEGGRDPIDRQRRQRLVALTDVAEVGRDQQLGGAFTRGKRHIGAAQRRQSSSAAWSVGAIRGSSRLLGRAAGEQQRERLPDPQAGDPKLVVVNLKALRRLASYHLRLFGMPKSTCTTRHCARRSYG